MVATQERSESGDGVIRMIDRDFEQLVNELLGHIKHGVCCPAYLGSDGIRADIGEFNSPGLLLLINGAKDQLIAVPNSKEEIAKRVFADLFAELKKLNGLSGVKSIDFGEGWIVTDDSKILKGQENFLYNRNCIRIIAERYRAPHIVARPTLRLQA